jgi:hypothetical protein
MTPAETASIVAQIESAFAGVKPGTITLREAETIDGYGTVAERARARAADREGEWHEVPDQTIDACPNALSHLDPESWRFYLPACMRFVLRTVHQRRRFPMDRLIYALSYTNDGTLDAALRARFRLLTAAQAEVVRRFLELAAAHDDLCDAVVARQALDQYWRSASDG